MKVTSPMKRNTISPSDLNIGDTVEINGDTFTIGANCIKTSSFGTTVRGEHFKKGITQVLFTKWYKGNIIGYVPQP